MQQEMGTQISQGDVHEPKKRSLAFIGLFFTRGIFPKVHLQHRKQFRNPEECLFWDKLSGWGADVLPGSEAGLAEVGYPQRLG